MNTTLQEFSETEMRVVDALNMATSGVANPEQWLIDALTASKSSSGVRVNTWSSLSIPTLWNSVSRIAGHVGMLPMEVRRRIPGGSEPTTGMSAAKVMQIRPNHLQTAMVFRETMTLHALLEGNGRAWINRNSLGQPVELIILKPSDTFGWMVDGEKYHSTWIAPDGYPDNASLQERYTAMRRGEGWQILIPDQDVLHIPGLSYDGLWGMSIIQVMKDVLGLDIAGRESSGHSFRNNGRPGLLLEAPRGVFRTEKEATEFMHNFNKAHVGVDNAGRTGLLRDGMKAHIMPLSSADAQFLESRAFSREDVALIFGTEAVLGDPSNVYKGITEQNAAYVQNCLNKWLEKWEQECNRKLLPVASQTSGTHFFSIDATMLLRGDSRSLAEYTASLRTQGIISGNEARRMHGLNPVPELEDDYANPAISTGPEPDTTEEPQQESEDSSPVVSDNAARIMFMGQMAYESRRIREGARADGNFITFCEVFYRKHQPKLERKLVSIGADPARAKAYCKRSMDLILDITGKITSDALPESMDALLDTWNDRIGELIDV